MIEPLKGIMVRAGATWVMWILVGLSVISLGVMLDRLRVFWAQKDDVPALAHELHRLLGQGDLQSARTRLAASPSAEAAVVLAGLMQWGRGYKAVQESLAAASGLARARMERRLLVLGTIGNNAPFVGLLGTVIGVVGAFEELGKGTVVASVSQMAPERVMSTIAEALVATAAGLIVAIPAVAVFNYFQGLLTTTLANAETLGHVLLAHLDDGEGQ
jgi:biopolymer transport protein ExbB